MTTCLPSTAYEFAVSTRLYYACWHMRYA